MASSGYVIDALPVAGANVSTNTRAMPRPRTKPISVSDQQQQLGRRIELAMHAAGFTTHTAMAKELGGVDHGTVGKWIAGTRQVNAIRAGQIADIADVTTDWLIRRDRRRVPTDVMDKIKALALPDDPI